LDNQEYQVEGINEEQKDNHQVKIINEFHFHGANPLNIYHQ